MTHEQDQYSRYRVNQQVRAVLVRHAVNLALLEYSFTGQTLYLYGSLGRDPSGELRPVDVQGLLKEVGRLPLVKAVQVDVDNWTIYDSEGSWQAVKRRVPAQGREDSTLHIKREEFINEVLDDLEKDGGER